MSLMTSMVSKPTKSSLRSNLREHSVSSCQSNCLRGTTCREHGASNPHSLA